MTTCRGALPRLALPRARQSGEVINATFQTNASIILCPDRSRSAYAENAPLDCSKKSLGDAIEDADENGKTIFFTGVCPGPIVIRTDGIALKGVGTAIIDGGGQNAVTITGASGVSLTNIEVRDGLSGIIGVNGAHLTLTNVNSHDNFVFGVSLQTASSAILSGVTANRNGVHGLDLETGSAATVAGTLTVSSNRVFGINVNGSSITFSRATVSATGNRMDMTHAGLSLSTGVPYIEIMPVRSEPLYKWKRFWCPPDGRLDLSDGGYLVDPDAEYTRFMKLDVVPFDKISGMPCLVLLGDPGMGKSTAIMEQATSGEAKASEQRDKVLLIDLKRFQTDAILYRGVFENSVFTDWLQGRHRLHLFLDSLDECLLRIDTLSAFLAGELQRFPIDRLFLRIACRSADWPSSFEQRLRDLWRPQPIGVYELAPLRRVDVAEAASKHGLEPERFLQEIWRTGSTAFAFKPITLRFLLNLFAKTGHFPLTQSELYKEGCLRLCEEMNSDRREVGHAGLLSSHQRLIIACRIAAATLFTNRFAVWTAADLGDVPPEDVTIQSLSGGTETANGREFEATESAIRETLATGLFSLRGTHRIGWAHQTYAEFLAARYVSAHGLSDRQTMSLIVHAGDPEGKIVPQLHETVAWLAGSSPGLFRKIMMSDPEVVLRSDIARVEPADRARLVDALLLAVADGRLFPDTDLRSNLHKLTHDGLAGQLAPYIEDRARKAAPRQLAIDIARQCGVRNLQADLAAVALDPEEMYLTRVHAALAVARIGDAETRALLKPLVFAPAEDPDDELKGYSLMALWPEIISADGLFSVLAPPKRESFFGAYRQFIRDVKESLKPEMLLSALKWAVGQVPRSCADFDRIIDALLLEGLPRLEDPDILQAYTEVVLQRLKHTYSVLSDRRDTEFSERLAKDDLNRKRLIAALVKSFSKVDQPRFTMLGFSAGRLTQHADMPWLIEECLNASSSVDQAAYATLISCIFDYRVPGMLDMVLVASRKSSVLSSEFSWLLKPIEFGSEQAVLLKKQYEEQEEWSKPKTPVLVEPPPIVRIVELLDESEAGNAGVFFQLTRELTLKPDSRHYGDDYKSELTRFPGWQAADIETQARILEAAKRFLLSEDPNFSWQGTDKKTYFGFVGGYRALRLLLKKEPQFLEKLDTAVWDRWSPALVWHPFPTSGDAEKEYHELLKMAYAQSPARMIEAIGLIIEKEDRDHQHVFVLRHFQKSCDGPLGEMLIRKLRVGTLSPRSVGAVLGILLDHHVAEARTFAESLLEFPLPSDANGRELAEVAGQQLALHAKDAGWNVLWPLMQQDIEFGKVLVEGAFAGGFAGQTLPHLNESQAGEFYLWLARQYPHAEDPKHEGAHFAGSREGMGRFRDAVLQNLTYRGTYAACEVIEKIAKELPEFDWLKWHIKEARNAARKHNWIPPKPEDILRLAENAQRRVVQNGEQLLDAISESLERLQLKLQGETPEVDLLWDKVAKGRYRPKDENTLSDYVKRHLENDLRKSGVVVNREVEIRRGQSPGKGERTDIHVDAVIRDFKGRAFDIITAIIEVKGCWHGDLKSAMETQLNDRYLRENQCDYGLYLVGWFNCPQWDTKDSRKPPKSTLEDAQQQLQKQSTDLSAGGKTIRAFVLNTALRH